MNPKKIMEIVFIFILPILFILPCISINKEYVYDNEGNFESSELSIDYNQNLFIDSYNQDIIVDPNNFLIYETHDLLNVTLCRVTINVSYINSLPDTIYYSENSQGIYNSYIDITLDNYTISLQEDDNFVIYISGNTDNEIILYQYNTNQLINGVDYRVYEKQSFTNFVIDSELVDIETFNYDDKPFYTLTKNSPWKSIKDLIMDNLYLNDTVVVDIIIDYTILWFVMFILWHLLYLFFDMLIHLFIDWGHSERKKL